MDIKSIIGAFPEVREPSNNLTVGDRIKWTAIASFLFLLLGFLSLPVDQADIPSYLQILPPYINFFSLLIVGIGPIITGILFMHVLLRFRILRLDLSNDKDRRFFYGLQKIIVLVFALFEAAEVISGLGLAHSFVEFSGLAVLMVFGTMSLLYLDDFVVKWGIGSGLALFVALGATKTLFFEGYYSLIQFFDQMLTYNKFDLSPILPLVFTLVLGFGIYKIIKKATVFDLTTGKVSGKYALVIFFTSFLGAVYFGTIDSMLNGPPTYFLNFSLTGLLLPDKWYILLNPSTLLSLAVYLCIALPSAFILSCFWLWVYGFHKLYSQPPSFRLEDKGRESELKEKLKIIIPISILTGVLMAPLTKMLSIAVAFTGILCLVGYINRFLEEVFGPQKACPVCGSLDIEWLIPISWCMWECRDCGYRGPIVIDLAKK